MSPCLHPSVTPFLKGELNRARMQGQINTWGSPTCAASRFNSALAVCRFYNFHHQVVNDDRVGLDPWWCDGRWLGFQQMVQNQTCLDPAAEQNEADF